MSNHPISTLSCDEFVWNQSTKVRCHKCGVPRGSHIGGYISTQPSDPAFDAYLSQPCEDCPQVATHNGFSKIDGRRGQFCNGHTDFDRHAHARND